MKTQTAMTTIDEQIQTNVLAELKWDARVRATEIGVTVKDGIVTLTGVVDSYWKRWAAQEAVHTVRTVQAVANDIEVHLPSSAERTDADLAEAVLFALKWDAAITAHTLNVTIAKGWVTLSGAVAYQYQRIDALRVINRIAGIRGITSLITVKTLLDPTNIKQDIEQALVRNAETDAKGIRVEVRDNTVILRGVVHSFGERDAAERSAWSAPGVTAVDNELTITYLV